MSAIIVFAILLFLSLGFAFLNGFHDAANAVATIIASRALSPRAALLIAAVANFVAPFLFGVAVAKTVGSEIVEPSSVTITVVLAALASASLWNIVTWWYGIPSSSSHALAGGLIGGAIIFGGLDVLKLDGLIKVALALFISPILGFVAGWITLRVILLLARGATPKINRTFNQLQLVTATALSLSHGTNDAQKAIGIIALGMVTLGLSDEFIIPSWSILASAAAMGLGTAMGGWRIIHTLGGKFYRIRPIHSFSSQLTSAAVILGFSVLGGPVSTTHVVSSSIVGVGAAQRKSQVRWTNLSDIGVAWLVTIPVTVVLAAAFYVALRPIFGP
ncbi:MAG: inorganic phosphate transporter [Chloroflexi bacterium]|nr:inorganic phosphate transporter [Chloroflexota bacterium]